MAQAVSRRPLTAEARTRPGQYMWDLWWTKWHYDRFFLRVLRFSPANIIPSSLSNSYHLGDEQYAVQRRNVTPSKSRYDHFRKQLTLPYHLATKQRISCNLSCC
jgi:hypothetical protein